LGKDSLLLNIFDEEISPLKFFLMLIIGGIIEYLGYISYNHIFNFKEVWANTYSTGGQLLDIILWPVAVIFLILAIIVGIYLAWVILKYIYLLLKNSPQLISHEIEIIRRIWDNRGFGKYSLFGGLSFYINLRLKVLAYVFAFLCLGIVTWYFAFQQHTYEKTHWKINFYYNEPLPEFKFKANIPYTIKASEDFYGIIINGRRFITGKNTSWTQDAPNKIPLILPKYWNITFPDTTYIEFLFYEDHISEIFSMTLEVWENKTESITVYPNFFTYRPLNESSGNKSSKPKNNKKN
jgi:hypothetical protein